MAEVLLLPLIQKLERRQPKLPEISGTRERAGAVISELRMMMDFLRDKKLEEGSRISYLLADTVEMVHNFLKLKRFFNEWYVFCEDIYVVHRWVIEVNRRVVIQFEHDGMKIESAMRSGGGDEEGVMGLEEDVQLFLHKAIFNEAKGLQFTVVRGMVGIGKTTLVRQVYNHPDVIGRFQRRAWVCISSELSHKEVFMELIQQVADSDESQRDLLKETMKHADNKTLQKMLHKHLGGMLYVIVLDEMPIEMSLESIWKALPDKGQESRVLITTRFLNLRTFGRAVKLFSSMASTLFNDHDMKFLDSDKSWQLFLNTIYCGNKLTSDDKFPKGLERRGRNMLTKCGGLPLAIKDVGEQVAKMRQSGSEWEELLESIDFDSILASLESSYQKLFPQLKLCFLHLGFFKENTTVKVRKLLQFWEVGGMFLEIPCYLESDVKSLIEESIVEVHQVSARYKYGIKSCRINAILHRLSIKKAEEEIGFEILSSNGSNRPSQDPRYRVINCSRDKFNYSTDGDKLLISLFFRGGGYFDTSPSYWKSLEQLRILELEDFGLRILPKSVGTLVELRYLGLRNNYVQELPDSLGCLEHLEVLDIAHNFMVEMPDIIWEMGSLRHLYMSDVICKKPLRIDGLQKLVTLTYISAENWTYEVSGLQMMTLLHEVGIEELDENSDVNKLFESLAKLRRFRSLILRGFRFRSMPCLDELGILCWLNHLKLDGLLAKLPCASNFPENLTYLKLVNSCLDEDPMPVLEKLSELLHLELGNAYTGKQMVISQNGFPVLEGLCIEGSWSLRNVRVEKEGMSKLESLEIKNCPYLEMFPEEMGSMAHLKEIKMVTAKHTAAKIRKSALISTFGGRVDINIF